MPEESTLTNPDSPKPAAPDGLKAVQFRRDGKLSKAIPIKLVIPGIKSGKLLASDEISPDGKKWVRLDKTPHLAQYFQTAEVLGALKDYPKLPNPQFIPDGAFRQLQDYKPLEDAIVQTDDKGWTLYPKSTFPLTFYGALNAETAQLLKQHLDTLCFSVSEDPDEAGDEVKKQEHEKELEQFQEDILLLITRNNLRCKEVDEYINVYKPFYMHKLEEQVKGSATWEISDQTEKHTLLNKFKAIAINSFEIKYGVNLAALFEGESGKLSLVTSIIEKFGAELLRFYFEKKKDIPYPGVHQVDKENKKDLDMFERLKKEELALHGEQIPIADILELIDFEPLRLMLYDVKPNGFADKNEAIEFGCKIHDMPERAKKAVQIEYLFQLQPFPEKFGRDDFHDFLKGFEYAYEIYSLVFLTIMGADFNLNIYLEEQPKKLPWHVVNKYCCPSCKDLLKIEYPTESCPRLPYHVGCNCYITLEKVKTEEEEMAERAAEQEGEGGEGEGEGAPKEGE